MNNAIEIAIRLPPLIPIAANSGMKIARVSSSQMNRSMVNATSRSP